MKKYIVFVLCFVWCLFSFSRGNAKDASFYAPHSALSSGKWVKVRVQENAIYKLTYENIQSFGIDPAKAKVYGYGGWMLNQDFSKNDYQDDLPEVPVWISGQDNVLNPGEFLLFYGKGHTQWTVASPTATEGFKHENNPYSDYGYYFIGEKEGPLKVVETASNETPGTTLDTFNDYALHERDLISVISSGRELYGENFSSERTQTFNFNINNIVPGNVTAEFRLMVTTSDASVSVSVGGNTIGTYRPGSKNYSDDQILSIEGKAEWSANNGTLSPALSHSHPGKNAYLDYLRIFVKRYLKPDGAYTFFRNVGNISANCTYTISGASQKMFVLELTEGKTIKKMPANYDGSTMSFHANKNSQLREFVLINPEENAFPVPEFVNEGIPNQDLHSLPQPDLVIITRPVYLEEANRLAEKHVSHSGLKVAVVTAEQVYNEFSSGTPDATAYRRLMNMFYDRAAKESEKPKYLLLFGDGAFDNRMLTSQW
ncbi:MAG: C25 family cysteine peptidase, partial [Dysgonamonadaceae bacterium]|nr:C25 family cysteine peptidase [Dysgonamonadaceae bacterium]